MNSIVEAANLPLARAADLHAIVRIGEDIRGVMGTARAVNLAAMNAMLASRRSGEAAVGFRVAALELRGMAAGLTEAMAGLSRLVFGLVRDVALRMHKQRTHDYFQRVENTDPKTVAYLDPLIARQEQEMGQLAFHLGQLRRELDQVARHALRLCDMGLSLSRSARVEAAYGGESAPVLKQVAAHQTEAIESVAATLRGLRLELAGERAGART
ncbi:MAG: hypothetical protein B7Y41_16520 [Hydrogenophilales bacterium 28-61-23]|nr:MAG: hypothetical protein B7Y41_16520 [Hydrogenophilales bacterium 28-61-23]